MLRDSDILSQIMSRAPKTSLPRDFYTSAEVFDADIRLIWAQDWIYALPSVEIPKTGNFVTLEIGDYSVIVVRGNDNAIRAFHNSCRHRGSRICQTAKGSNPKLVCPYHQWTYELDGRLLWARDMGADFDPSKHGLKTVHCRDAAGMVFICLADLAPAFDKIAEMAARYMGPHHLEDTKVAYQSSIIEEGNWKLVLENNRECYHCSGSHPSLCRTFDDNPNIVGSGEGGEDPAVSAHRERCEAAGLPSEFHIDPSEQWRFVRVPLLGAAESYTMDGKVGVKKLLTGMPIKNAGTLLFFHYPNTWNHFLSDQILTFRVLPISATRTQVTTTWLVHKDAVEGVDYNLDRLTEVWVHTNDEDRIVVEQNQLGINSPAYSSGPYSDLQESGVIQFIDWYTRALQDRLTGRKMIAAE